MENIQKRQLRQVCLRKGRNFTQIRNYNPKKWDACRFLHGAWYGVVDVECRRLGHQGRKPDKIENMCVRGSLADQYL